MRKTFIIIMGAAIVLSSCGSNTGTGAAVGAQFGTILGSAIGGISGGWYGSDVGKIVGMAGGAAVGAAVGAAADKKQQRQMEAYEQERQQRWQQRQQQGDGVYGDSGFDARNQGDDRIDFDGAGPRQQQPATRQRGHAMQPAQTQGSSVTEIQAQLIPAIEIRHARILDADNDGIIQGGEECRISFEIMNRSATTLYDVQPTVTDVSGNKYIHISPNLHIESIAPNSGVRYTATILADKRLKDGEAVIRVGVIQGDMDFESQSQDFTVQTRKQQKKK